MSNVIRLTIDDEPDAEASLKIYLAAKKRFNESSGGFGSWDDLSRREKLKFYMAESRRPSKSNMGRG